MVASELAVTETAPVVAVADVGRSRTRGYVQGALILLAGIAIVWIGLVPMGRVAGIIKVPVVLIGILAIFKGIDQIAKAAARAVLRDRLLALHDLARVADPRRHLRRLPAPR